MQEHTSKQHSKKRPISFTREQRYEMLLETERRTRPGEYPVQHLMEVVGEALRDTGQQLSGAVPTRTCSQACPFDPQGGNDYGCLPSAAELMATKIAQGHGWACHSEPWKLCTGFASVCGASGLPAGTGTLYNESGAVTDTASVRRLPSITFREVLEATGHGKLLYKHTLSGDPTRLARRMLSAVPTAEIAVIRTGTPGRLRIYGREGAADPA